MSGFAIASWLRAPGPVVAVEIATRRVTAVALSRRRDTPGLAGQATEYLREGAVVAALNAPNITDPEAVAAAVHRAVSRAAGRVRRVGLVVPDTVAKVSFVRFEKVPAKPEDLAQMVRWQVRKAAPFRIDDAQVSAMPGVALAGGGREFIVTVARRDIIEEYERVCTAAGTHAGVVDLATLNLLNVAMAGEGGTTQGDWLLLHVTADYTTIAIVRNGDLIFFRTLREEGEGSLTDFVHQTAMYYEDRLTGTGFTRVLVAGTADAGATIEESEMIHRALRERLDAKVEQIDPRMAVELHQRITAAPEALDALAAPIGLLVRDSAA